MKKATIFLSILTIPYISYTKSFGTMIGKKLQLKTDDEKKIELKEKLKKNKIKITNFQLNLMDEREKLYLHVMQYDQDVWSFKINKDKIKEQLFQINNEYRDIYSEQGELIDTGKILQKKMHDPQTKDAEILEIINKMNQITEKINTLSESLEKVGNERVQLTQQIGNMETELHILELKELKKREKLNQGNLFIEEIKEYQSKISQAIDSSELNILEECSKLFDSTMDTITNKASDLIQEIKDVQLL